MVGDILKILLLSPMPWLIASLVFFAIACKTKMYQGWAIYQRYITQNLPENPTDAKRDGVNTLFLRMILETLVKISIGLMVICWCVYEWLL